MVDNNAELRRLERELLAEEETMDLPEIPAGEIPAEEETPVEELSVDDILHDAELTALLENVDEEAEPAFEDPDETRPAEGEVPYNNFANDYGKDEAEDEAKIKERNDKIAIGLMLGACALCLGIIGILIYWICVLP